MRFLADQDVYAITIAFLNGLGHDVVRALNSVWRAEDAELLRVAHEQGRIFVTRDRDFGASFLSKAADLESSICAFCLRPRTPCMSNWNGY